MSGPYRETPEVPPCAQHHLVQVLDEHNGMEIWCADCEKLWWSGSTGTYAIGVAFHELRRHGVEVELEVRAVVVDGP